MNKDLREMAKNIEKLPQNIGHFSFFSDVKGGEFIFTSDTIGDHPFLGISKVYENQVSEGVVDYSMELFRANLYAAFFEFIKHEGIDTLMDMQKCIELIIRDQKYQ